MTIVGHIANISIVGGTAGIISPKATLRVIVYYVIVMALFLGWAQITDPGNLAAIYIDWTGYAICFAFLYAFYRKGTEGERFFLATLVGVQLLAGNSHTGDAIEKLLIGRVGEGAWRPHHFFHTPLFGLGLSLIATPLTAKLFRLTWRRALAGIYIGYCIHIIADAITYDFPTYWFWPFSDWSKSLAVAWYPSLPAVPSCEPSSFGNILYRFDNNLHTPNPKWGWIMYVPEPLINVLLGLFFALVLYLRRGGMASYAPPAEPPPQ